ncbi:cysteine hydrolase [Devosia sp. PTR5]|uniref:Cysteine hydrolase n=1 Tax=Devosia oryzisoli TaxID=2774138 RepID=A0A927FWR4_9HYPH|nr:cysteine hydrolase [Devosia oryzisoli]MBD8066937.1 cysteine hydrolase [Devosia oryzisoli]
MPRLAHLCIDMQTMFASSTPWAAPWMERVLPAVDALAQRFADATVFTRFIPPPTPADAPGSWQRYYDRWPKMTRSQLAPELIDLVPQLRRHVPPARIFDKPTYSPWVDGRLHHSFQDAGINTLLISGGETDICVLAAVLGAIDLGYHVVIVEDAVFGSADETHEAILTVYRSRLAQQLTLCTTADAIDHPGELV